MDLSIIILNYKSLDKTLRCLESIKKSDLNNLVYEIIVVDNNSEDNSEKGILEKFSKVNFIKSEKNLGMGGGNNLGIKEAKGEFILILNPDTLILNNAIKTLFFYIKENVDVGIVGPKLLNTDNTLQYSCLRFPKIYTPFLRRTFLGKFTKNYLDKFLMKDFSHNEIKEVDWLIGSCLMIRKEFLEKIGGGFDKKFFMYFEDTDLCKKMWDNKFKVIYNPNSVVIHDHARESAKNKWLFAPFVDKLAREHIKSWIKYFFN